MISANGVEYKNVPEQVQYLTEQVADIWTAIEGINPPDLTLYALKTYVDAADSALSTRITAVESSIGTLLTKTEAANTYAKIADIGTYINLSDYVKTTDMYTYVQAEIQNFDLDSNTDFTALKSRVSTLESSVSSMTSDIADANATAANAQTAAGNAVNTANSASAVATNAYNTATSAASDVADMQTTINNYDSRIDAVESTVSGFEDDLETAQNTANAALTKAESALSMIAGLHSLTKEEVEFEGDSVTVTGFVEGSLCTLTKLEGDTKASENLLVFADATNYNEEVEFTLKDGVMSYVGEVTRRTQWIRGEITLIAGTYTLVDAQASRANTGCTIFLQTISETPTYYDLSIRQGQQKLTFTLTETTTLRVVFDIRDLNVQLNTKLYPMLVKGETAPTEFVAGYDGLKSVSISGLSTGGGVVITTSEGTTSLVPTLDDDTLELGSYDYMEQVISGTQLTTSLIQEGTLIDLEDVNWGYLSNKSCWYGILSDAVASGYYEATNIVCDTYTPTGKVMFDNPENYPMSITIMLSTDVGLSGNTIVVYNGSDSVQPTGKLYYKLATPVTTVLATVTYTDVSAFFEAGATITVNNANTEYDVESTSTMYGYVAE